MTYMYIISVWSAGLGGVGLFLSVCVLCLLEDNVLVR